MEPGPQPSRPLRVTVVLRPEGPDPRPALLSGKSVPRQPRTASAEAYSAVEAFARKNGLNVEDSDPATRTIVLSGSAERMNRAFGIRHERDIHLPPGIRDYVLAVLGLDPRPVARPH